MTRNIFILFEGQNGLGDRAEIIKKISSRNNLEFSIYDYKSHDNYKIRKLLQFFYISAKCLLQTKNSRFYFFNASSGLLFGILSAPLKLFFNFEIVILTFIIPFYKYKSSILFKTRIFLTQIALKFIAKIICFSSYEKHYYSNMFNEKNKFTFVPLGTLSIRRVETKEDNYIFSGGMSNRDFDFLIDALQNSDYHLKILCTVKEKNRIIKKYPNIRNIELINNAFGDAWYNLIAKSNVVVLPLKDNRIASGQLTFLNAIELGKVVIITKGAGAEDYLINNKSAMFFEQGSVSDFLCKLNRVFLSSPFKQEISRNAREIYNNQYTYDKFIERILKI